MRTVGLNGLSAGELRTFVAREHQRGGNASPQWCQQMEMHIFFWLPACFSSNAHFS